MKTIENVAPVLLVICVILIIAGVWLLLNAKNFQTPKELAQLFGTIHNAITPYTIHVSAIDLNTSLPLGNVSVNAIRYNDIPTNFAKDFNGTNVVCTTDGRGGCTIVNDFLPSGKYTFNVGSRVVLTESKFYSVIINESAKDYYMNIQCSPTIFNRITREVNGYAC